MAIFYSFNLRISTEYQQWLKLRGKLYAQQWLPLILDDPFKIVDGENWGLFKFVGGVAGWHMPAPVKVTPTRNTKTPEYRAVVWMYARPFRTYAQAARKYTLNINDVKRVARAYRAACSTNVNPVQETVDLLMAEYLCKPIRFTLSEYAARYGIAEHTISKRIRDNYSPAQWPHCIQKTRKALSKAGFYGHAY